MDEANEYVDVLAALAVRDLDASVAWTSRVIGRDPDAHPMEGLAEWYLGVGTVQLSVDAHRAGGSMLTLVVSDIEQTAARLQEAGIGFEYDDVTSTKVRFGQLQDPDGNSIAIVESKPGYDPAGGE